MHPTSPTLPAPARALAFLDASWSWVFGLMLATLPFLDNFWPSFEGTKAAYRGSMMAAALLFVVQGVLLELARPGAAMVGLAAWAGRFLGLYGGVCAFLHVMALRFSNIGDISFLHILHRDYYYLPLLMMALVVTRRSDPRARAAATTLVVARALLFAAFLLALTSCATSYHPLESLRDFRNDLGAALTSVVVLLGVAHDGRLLRRLLGVFLAVATYIAVVNFFALHRFGGATEIERLAWIDVGLVYAADYYYATPEVRAVQQHFDFRPMFPFGHHNRLSNFAMMATAAGLILVPWPGMGRRRRAAALLGTLASFVLMNLTLGRGAWMAFFAGLTGAALLVADLRRRSHLLLAGACCAAAVAGFSLLPAGQRERLGGAVAALPTMWRAITEPGAGDLPEDLNARRRLVAMETAIEAIRTEPLTGVGYGYHAYELVVPRLQPAGSEPDPQESEQFQSHSHNNVLQVAAETGLPSLAAFLSFHAASLVVLVRAARRAHRDHHPLRWPVTLALGLFLMTHAYGMTNYALRYTIGHLTWLMWATALLLALQALRPDGGAAAGADGSAR